MTLCLRVFSASGTEVLVLFGRTVSFGIIFSLTATYTQERLTRSAYLANHLLEAERQKSENLLQNMLPTAIAQRLKDSSETIADDHESVTVLLADVADFTPFSARMPARDVVGFLNEVFSRFDRLVERHALEKIKTVGDAYMVIGGAPTPREDHLEAVARLALAMQAEAQKLSHERGVSIQFRIGIHTGPLIAGVIGEKRFLYDVWGDTVNTASRMESHGVPGKIQVTQEVAQRLKGRFALAHRGPVEVKGKGAVDTWFLEGEITLSAGQTAAAQRSEHPEPTFSS